MKRMHKLLAILLAAMLVFCASVTVFAEGDETEPGTEPGTETTESGTESGTEPEVELGSITLNGATAGKSYRIYRIFDLQYVAGTPVKVAYTMTEDWADFFKTEPGSKYLLDKQPSGKTLNQIVVDGEIKFINITETNKADFAKDALVYAAKLPGDAEKTADGKTLVFDELPLGYYLVYPVGATGIQDGRTAICSLTSTTPNATANVKAKYPTFDKDAEGQESKDDKVVGSVQVGDDVKFTLTSYVPDTTGYDTYIFRFKDKMSDGLQLNVDSFKITVGGVTLAPEYYTLDTTATDETTFTVTFDILKMVADKVATVNQKIEVVYTAKVLESAVEQVEDNKAKLEYSNDPGDETKTEETPEVVVKVYSAKIVINKVDGANKTLKLPGAQFVLYKVVDGDILYYHWNAADEKVEWVAEYAEEDIRTTDEDGAAAFTGLEDGTYFLKEIVAPNGYNLLPDPIEVDVPKATEDDNGDPIELAPVAVTATVENNTGTTLPSTGGIGTTIFYVLGGVLVVGAAVLLVTKKRMSISK